ncbi:MAG: phosphoribosylformylglycinamidine cyclo-ligase, partial [Acidobacteria bacterium]|nr:phosphoribosylformylglycinamidine cyclo-ligase [Acidobacteriota bacterium]
VKGTRTPGVLADLGNFGGLFRPQLDGFDEAVLVASADGVGTKLKAAFLSGVHDTVGRDLVNHCVNDILVQGAKPLFFLDYIATGRLEPRVLASIVEGLANGCRENGCALLGGETAEMPGFYAHGEYDVAGFIVGIVDRPRLLDGSAVRHGDLLVGLPSSGMHTNGFSLARKIFFDVAGLGIDDRVDELGETVGQSLLAEHKSYLPALSGVIDRLHALAHITGGGLTDNLPRVLPAGCTARIERGRWEIPKLFDYMAHRGGVAEDEMFRTFNMGIGMVAIVSPDQAGALESHLDALGERHVRIGSVVPGEGGVLYA